MKKSKSNLLLALLPVLALCSNQTAFARKHSAAAASSHHHHSTVVASSSKHGHHTVIVYKGSQKHTEVVATGHHLRHHEAVAHAVAAKPKTRYAYPLDIFMLKPPEFERSPFDSEIANQIQRSFNQGYADNNPARSLVRAGIVSYHPLHGGIFWRREPVKYIIMHSTETGVPQVASRVIDSWGSMGRRHAGAQYVVDRDGTIIQAVDPDLATVHINIFKTLPGINNDNSIGIEMCHCGHQDYPAEQRQAVMKLVTYLQDRYKIDDENIITHRYAQQGDHTDPVYFDFEGFLADKSRFRNKAIAYRVNKINAEPLNIPDAVEAASAAPSAYLQPHTAIMVPVTTTTTTTVTVTRKKDLGDAHASSPAHAILHPVLPPQSVPVITPMESAAPLDAKASTIESDSGSTTTYTWSSKNARTKPASPGFSAPAVFVPPVFVPPSVKTSVPASLLRGPIEVVPNDLGSLNSSSNASSSKKQGAQKDSEDKALPPADSQDNADDSGAGMKFIVH